MSKIYLDIIYESVFWNYIKTTLYQFPTRGSLGMYGEMGIYIFVIIIVN